MNNCMLLTLCSTVFPRFVLSSSSFSEKASSINVSLVLGCYVLPWLLKALNKIPAVVTLNKQHPLCVMCALMLSAPLIWLIFWTFSGSSCTKTNHLFLPDLCVYVMYFIYLIDLYNSSFASFVIIWYMLLWFFLVVVSLKAIILSCRPCAWMLCASFILLNFKTFSVSSSTEKNLILSCRPCTFLICLIFTTFSGSICTGKHPSLLMAWCLGDMGWKRNILSSRPCKWIKCALLVCFKFFYW